MSDRDIVERLQAPANWLRQDRGVTWKEATNKYDRAPFDAAAEILRLRSELADAKRAGWIAGRDAAADLVLKISQQKWAEYDVRTASMSIRNMEPPA